MLYRLYRLEFNLQLFFLEMYLNSGLFLFHHFMYKRTTDKKLLLLLLCVRALLTDSHI